MGQRGQILMSVALLGAGFVLGTAWSRQSDRVLESREVPAAESVPDRTSAQPVALRSGPTQELAADLRSEERANSGFDTTALGETRREWERVRSKVFDPEPWFADW